MASPEQVREQVDRILASQWFAGAERRGKLLRYLVQQALAGDRGSVKESVLAAEVFERGTEYDSRVDSLVRMEVGRLRSRLAEYYVNAGQKDAIRIDIPKGSYLPQITATGAAITEENREPAPVPPVVTQKTASLSPVFGGLALLAIGVVLVWWSLGRRPPEPPSVAILPFLNLTGSPDQEFLSDSITDELTEALAETKGMRVVARTSAFQFKGKAGDVREIGRKLNVSALLEGSVKRTGDGLELIVQLIRTGDGYHVWSKTFGAAERDLHGVEGEIASATRHALLPSGADAGQPELRSTDNPEAHNLYLQAAYLFHKGDLYSLRQSAALARQAVKLDPSFVRAHWVVIKAEQNLVAQGSQSTGDAEAHSAESWNAVLALDPGSADAHTQIAFRAYERDWDWPRAEAEFRTALASGGSHGNAHNLYGWCLMTRARFVEAHQHFDAALEIDPLVQAGARANSAIAWMMERKFDRARQVVDSIFQLNPQSGPALALQSWFAQEEGDWAAARALAKKVEERFPDGAALLRARLEAGCGDPAVARQLLEKLANQRNYGSPFDFAEIYSMLGDTDRAVEYLNQAAEAKTDTVLYLQIDP